MPDLAGCLDGRQLVRSFLGCSLDERLITGPDAEQRASLIGIRARELAGLSYMRSR
jgi:hypothetical protein